MSDTSTLNTANTVKVKFFMKISPKGYWLLFAVLNEIFSERKVKELKRQVEGWREVIVLVQSVLIWDENWYPGLIFGFSTFTFLLFWFLDPSLLTALSMICLLITVLDTLVPTVTATLCNPTSWTGNKERQLEEFCRTVVEYKIFVVSHWTNFQNMKTTQPKLYYTVVILSLSFLAWIGNWNNMVLTYFFVTAVLMVPGLAHHGFLQKYYRATLLCIASMLRSLTGDKVKTK